MSYDDVVTIIGRDGELSSEVTAVKYNISLYTWVGQRGNGSNANVTLQSGKVMTNASLGLKNEANLTDTDWKEMFTLTENIKNEARRLQLTEYDNTLSYFAAVALKDFGNELQKQWCKSILLKVVTNEIGDLIKVDGISNKSFDGSRPEIYILPLLIEDEELLIKELIFKSSIHPNKEIRFFMVRGIHNYLLESDPDFVNNCISGIILYCQKKILEII